jgi:hypothetical protein
MSRRWSNTIRYDSVALYASPSGVNYGTGVNQLHRIQSADFQISVDNESNQELGSFEERYPNENGNRSSLNFSYYPTDGWNESNLGFIADSSNGAVFGQNGYEQDCYMSVDDDVNSQHVFAFGNMSLINYSFSADVGSPAFVTASLEGYNSEIVSGVSGNVIPRIQPNGTRYTGVYSLPTATSGVYDDFLFVSRGNVEVVVNDSGFFGIEDDNYALESINFDISLPRVAIKNMNDIYPLNKNIQPPIEGSLGSSFLILKTEVDDFKRFICSNSNELDINLYHGCGADKNLKLNYSFSGLRVDSFQYGISIGDKMRVEVDWNLPFRRGLDSHFWLSGDFSGYY